MPVNFSTWEPDIIGILSSYGAKAVSEVISHLRCKISLINEKDRSVFEIKYTILLIYPKLVFWKILTGLSHYTYCSHAASPQGGCQFCSEASYIKRSDIVWLVTNGHVTQGVPRSERGHSLTLTPVERLLSLHVVPW